MLFQIRRLKKEANIIPLNLPIFNTYLTHCLNQDVPSLLLSATLCAHIKHLLLEGLKGLVPEGSLIGTKKIEFLLPLLDACGNLFECCNCREERQKKFMERGQGILDLGRRGKYLDKEREDRKKEKQEHFKRYEKTKKEAIKKGLKGKE